MLKQRVITALALMCVLVPTLLSDSQVPMAILSLTLCALGAWEWGRLNGLSFTGSSVLGGVCSLMCAASWYYEILLVPNYYFWLICTALWVLVASALLRLGPARWLNIYIPLRLVAGVWALYITWLAIYKAKVIRINFLLSIFDLVWMSDIGAYFFGRAFGRRKLAVNISPGKSWEGVWGGVFAVILLSCVWGLIDQSRFGITDFSEIPNQIILDQLSLFSLLGRKGIFIQILALIFMVSMSVVGDLLESLVKRSVGAKDSSKLLPGHGGVLDRIDALLPSLPIAMFWSLI